MSLPSPSGDESLMTAAAIATAGVEEKSGMAKLDEKSNGKSPKV